MGVNIFKLSGPEKKFGETLFWIQYKKPHYKDIKSILLHIV